MLGAPSNYFQRSLAIYAVVAIDSMVGLAVVTTIQVNEDTQKKLLQIIARIQAETGRRTTYDEALNILMKGDLRVRRARKEFARFYGALRGDKGVWKELRELRKSEEDHLKKLEREFS